MDAEATTEVEQEVDPDELEVSRSFAALTRWVVERRWWFYGTALGLLVVSWLLDFLPGVLAGGGLALLTWLTAIVSGITHAVRRRIY